MIKMPLGFAQKDAPGSSLLHDTSAQAPTSCSLSDCAFAGTPKMAATAQMIMMRDMKSSRVLLPLVDPNDLVRLTVSADTLFDNRISVVRNKLRLSNLHYPYV